MMNLAASRAGRSDFNPEEVDFLGISMGSIFGTVFSAIEPQVERPSFMLEAVVGHMMSRAASILFILRYFNGNCSIAVLLLHAADISTGLTRVLRRF